MCMYGVNAVLNWLVLEFGGKVCGGQKNIPQRSSEARS